MMQTEWRPESLAIAQKLKTHAEALGMTPSQFALAWVLDNRLVTSVICGPRTEAQLLDYVGVIGRRLPAASEAMVDGLVAPGHLCRRPGILALPSRLNGATFASYSHRCWTDAMSRMVSMRSARASQQDKSYPAATAGAAECAHVLR